MSEGSLRNSLVANEKRFGFKSRCGNIHRDNVSRVNSLVQNYMRRIILVWDELGQTFFPRSSVQFIKTGTRRIMRNDELFSLACLRIPSYYSE